MFAVLLSGILQGVECPVSLCHVVTDNGVTICGSKFPPTVSKHCQHQHRATHKIVQQYETQINLSTCDTARFSLSSVQHHGSFSSYEQQSIVSCVFMSAKIEKKKHYIENLNFYSVQPLPTEPLRFLPKMPKCQHTAVHFNFLMLN